MRPKLSAVIAALLSVSASALPATAGDNEKPMVMAEPGWYAVVGCARGGQANSDAPPGTYVIDTNQYPNFRNGWFVP
ncbi:MAG: hypothetical protein R3D34_04875 [Nitratireductor sp.]